MELDMLIRSALSFRSNLKRVRMAGGITAY